MTFADSICEHSSSTTFRSTRQGSLFSTASSPARSNRSPMRDTDRYRMGNALASTMATFRSTPTLPLRRFFSTFVGSATPLSSTTTWSNAADPSFSRRVERDFTESATSPAPGPQQTQPFSSSSISTPSISMVRRRMVAASTFTAATSFTSTAIFKPFRFVRMCVSAVVLPAPRKPPNNVVGGSSTFTSVGAIAGVALGICEEARPALPVRLSI